MDRWKVVAPPNMPSTYDEGQPGGGFDVGVPLDWGGVAYFQFKIPLTLDHRRSGEADELDVPYFRAKIQERGPNQTKGQHEMLLELENRPNSVVAYATPKFASAGDLESHFIANTIASHSLIVAPSMLKISDFQVEHHLNYRAADDKLVVRSQPLVIQGDLNPGQISDRGFDREDLGVTRIDSGTIIEMSTWIEDRAEGLGRRDLADALGGREGFDRLRLAARLVFSVEAVPMPYASSDPILPIGQIDGGSA